MRSFHLQTALKEPLLDGSTGSRSRFGPGPHRPLDPPPFPGLRIPHGQQEGRPDKADRQHILRLRTGGSLAKNMGAKGNTGDPECDKSAQRSACQKKMPLMEQSAACQQTMAQMVTPVVKANGHRKRTARGSVSQRKQRPVSLSASEGLGCSKASASTTEMPIVNPVGFANFPSTLPPTIMEADRRVLEVLGDPPIFHFPPTLIEADKSLLKTTFLLGGPPISHFHDSWKRYRTATRTAWLDLPCRQRRFTRKRKRFLKPTCRC